MSDPKSASLFQRATETGHNLRQAVPEQLQKPKIAIVCGSGLGGLVDTINPESRVEIPYSKIPTFPISTGMCLKLTIQQCSSLLDENFYIDTSLAMGRVLVQGHAGKLVFGTLGLSNTPVLLLVGRSHFYEGHSMELVTFATRICKVLGVEIMLVTNAAGGLNQDYSVGDIVLLNDHLNLPGLAGIGPLIGPNADDFGPRFPPLSDAYDLDLRRRTHTAWKKLGIDGSKRRIHEGVYAYVAGPSYETRAECRMLRTLGADVVGMSTVPEIVVARHCGMRVLAFSLVTNKSVLEPVARGDDAGIRDLTTAQLDEFLSRGRANHEEVLEAGRQAAMVMQDLVKAIVEDLSN